MPNWLYVFAGRLAASGMLSVLASKEAIATAGFALVLFGSLFGSIPTVLIGGFTLLWISNRDKPTDKPAGKTE